MQEILLCNDTLNSLVSGEYEIGAEVRLLVGSSFETSQERQFNLERFARFLNNNTTIRKLAIYGYHDNRISIDTGEIFSVLPTTQITDLELGNRALLQIFSIIIIHSVRATLAS